MKYNSVVAILFISIFLQSCAFAPFSTNYAARTVGKGNVAAQVGTSADICVPYARLGYGLGEYFDIGVLTEDHDNVLLGGWLKYAFINQIEGTSFSVEVSGGASGSSSYYYIGPTIGYKWNWWEPYLLMRYNYVEYSYEIETDLGFLRKNIINEGNYQYGLLTVGNTLWANDWLGLNLNVNKAVGDLSFFYYSIGVVVEF